jgi:uncharacterized iron-regulated membrane protein
MSKPLLLSLHRWITLVFALPLAVLIVTGLILSFEPMLLGQNDARVTAQSVEAALARHDPQGKARSLAVRSYAGTISISGAQHSQAVHVDLSSNAALASPGALAELFMLSRQLHEKLLLDLRWLVSAATIAMLALIALGIAMGWPRLRNTVSGWHKGVAWFALPLLILSPLTGLALAFGITFASPPAAPGGTVSLREAVQQVAAMHDLGRVVWIRPRGGAMLARVNDGGEMRVYAVTRDGLQPTARNWPRLIHEGNWGGALSALVNVVTSAALMLLISTGLWLWARRKLRRRIPRPAAA